MFYTIKPQIEEYRALAILDRTKGVALARRTNESVKDLADNLAVEWIEETSGRSDCDFPRFTSLLICLSEVAKSTLWPYLKNSGELFELVGITENYYAFNCLNVVDVMDVELASKMENDGDILSIYDNEAPLAIDLNKLGSYPVGKLLVFKVPQIRNKFVVSQKFKDLYEDAGLIGLDFLPCVTA